MGYIKKVVQTGVEFADTYQLPEYVAKARESSKIVDAASVKIQNFYCEKGSPLLQKVDEITAAKIETALAVANNKVEQAQTLKTAAAAKVHEKTTEALEIAKQTKASAYEKGFKVKKDGIAKYQQLKVFSSKKVDETKTIMRDRVAYASEEACRLEQTLEQKLKEKAATNEYANKVLSVVMTAKEQVKIYSEALVKKSLALPLTLQERMEKGLSFAKAQVKVGSATVEAKRAELLLKLKKSYEKMNSANALIAVRNVFGEKAALTAEEKLQELKKANLYGKFADKMTSMYKYSLFKVGKFAEKAEEMEATYLKTSVVAKFRTSASKAK